MKHKISQLEEKVLAGEWITPEEAFDLAETEDMEELLAAAGRIRRHYTGNAVSLCTIMNTRSGKCPEDCKYCAQSAHYATGVVEYPLIDADEVVKLARENENLGVHRFAVVTSGRALSDKEFEGVLTIIRRLKKETRLQICASLGFMTRQRAQRLKQEGLYMFHNNLETSREFFPEICSTHTYDEKLETIRNVLDAGLDVCCGGIIGMGESLQDRIRMVLEIRQLGIRHVPINILNPIPGTPLQHIEQIAPEEVVKTMAIFRFVLPAAEIRFAAGRINLGNWQRTALLSGVNGVMVGNYLTTIGNRIEDDIAILKELDLEI